MKKNGRISLIIFTVLWMFTQTIPVLAEGGTRILMKQLGELTEDKMMEVVCAVENGDGITNGKLRIMYDAQWMKLTDTGADEALDGALCEVNDCLTGNKPEGEIVVAFASSSSIREEGSLVKLNFNLPKGIPDEGALEVTVVAEKIGGDAGTVQVNTENLIIRSEKGNPDDPDDDNKDDDNKKDPDDDKKDDQNQGDHDGQSGNGSGNGDKKNQGGSKNQGSTSKKSTSRPKGNIKTGDDTRIIPFVLTGSAAAGVAVWMVRRKKKEDAEK